MNSEIFDKAQIILQNRRRNAVVENERRIDEINMRIPQIREINNTIASAGKDLIKIIGAGGTDVQQKIEQLKRNKSLMHSLHQEVYW